jgi:hypothetical protein
MLRVRPGRHVPVAATSVFAALVVLPAGAAGQASTPGCSPPVKIDPGLVSNTTRTADGREVTEALPGGAYRVTQCAADGGLVRSVVAAPYTAPGGPNGFVPAVVTERQPDGLMAAATATYANPYTDPQAAEAWLGPEGAALRGKVPPPSRGTLLSRPNYPSLAETQSNEPVGLAARLLGKRVRPGSALARAAGIGQCDDSTYAFLTSAHWYSGRYSYRTKNSTYPDGDATRVEITRGHHSWDTTRNSCGWADQDNTTSDWTGTTSTGFHTYDDGIDIVDFGDMSNVGQSNSTTIGYTMIWWSGNELVGTDERFNQFKGWSNSGDASRYDVWNLATHETGHAIGLADLYDASHEEMTMYGYTSHGDVKRRTLGRGDMIGMRTKYP